MPSPGDRGPWSRRGRHRVPGVADARYRPDVPINQAVSFEGNLVVASGSILSHARDEILRDLGEGWPRAVDGPPGARDSGGDLPEPNAAVASGALRLLYGDARRPALEPPPILPDRLDANAQ